MKRAYIYWGLGITAAVVTTGILIHRHKKEIGDVAQKTEKTVNKAVSQVQSWIKPVASKITTPFGNRIHPVTKKPQFHNGIDLKAPVNTPIKSPFDGVVQKVYSDPKVGGNQLIIKHDNGYTTGYAHLTKALFKQGDKVKQGDVVAMSGNTGRTTGPHLHFTLKDKSGNWVDPEKLMYKVA